MHCRPAHSVLLSAAVLTAPLATSLPGQEPPRAASSPALTARVDPRVELLSTVFRLAGNPEYSQAKVEAHAQAVDAHFGKLREHPVVLHARELRRTRGVSYDAVMSLAVHLGGDLQPAQPLGGAARLDPRWTAAEAEAFAGELGDCARASEAGREQHPSLESFFPHIRALLADYAPRFAAEQAAAPPVVPLVPANGAQDIDPALGALVITFDRPMRDGSWSAAARTSPRSPARPSTTPRARW